MTARACSLALLCLASPAAAAGLRVEARDCYGASGIVERLLPELAPDFAGELRVRCFSESIAWKEPHLLLEIDGELAADGATRMWRGAELIPQRARRSGERLAELAANVLALAMRREPAGQGSIEPPRAGGKRPLAVVAQVSNQHPGGCEHAAALLNQHYKTHIIGEYFELVLLRCELVEEQSLESGIRAAATAARALDARTDFVAQLTTRPVWGTSESVLGVTQLLGRVPFATLSARPPVQIGKLARVLAHELGHLCALPHVDGSDIMFPSYREHGDFHVTRELFAIGSRRWLRRPWMREQRFFDDPCPLVAAWSELLDAGFIASGAFDTYRLATSLLGGPGEPATLCAARLLESSCRLSEPRACRELAELREHGWLTAK